MSSSFPKPHRRHGGEEETQENSVDMDGEHEHSEGDADEEDDEVDELKSSESSDSEGSGDDFVGDNLDGDYYEPLQGDQDEMGLQGEEDGGEPARPDGVVSERRQLRLMGEEIMNDNEVATRTLDDFMFFDEEGGPENMVSLLPPKFDRNIWGRGKTRGLSQKEYGSGILKSKSGSGRLTKKGTEGIGRKGKGKAVEAVEDDYGEDDWEEDDDDEGEYLQSDETEIQLGIIHNVSAQTIIGPGPEKKIIVVFWVGTPFAWYRLVNPHKDYENVFHGIGLNKMRKPGSTPSLALEKSVPRFSHLFQTIVAPEKGCWNTSQNWLSKHQLAQLLEANALSSTRRSSIPVGYGFPHSWRLKTPLMPSDFDDFQEELFHSLKGAGDMFEGLMEDLVEVDEQAEVIKRMQEAGLDHAEFPQQIDIDSNDDDEVFVKPIVKKLAGTMFLHTLKCLPEDEEGEAIEDLREDDPELAEQYEEFRASVSREATPIPSLDDSTQREGSIEWVGRSIGEDNEAAYYEAVQIKNQCLRVGDFVRLKPGQALKKRQTLAVIDIGDTGPDFDSEGEEEGEVGVVARSEEQEQEARRVQWAQIAYLYEDSEGRKRFHGRWVVMGKTTLLAEIAGPKELFAIEDCDELPLDAILEKEDVKMLAVDKEENWSEEGHWFIRYSYDPIDLSFKDFRLSESCEFRDPYRQCPCCERHLLKTEGPRWVLEADPDSAPKAFVFRGLEYHLFDWVFLQSPFPDNDPYIIAQILSISNVEVQAPGSQAHVIVIDDADDAPRVLREEERRNRSRPPVKVEVQFAVRVDDLVRIQPKLSLDIFFDLRKKMRGGSQQDERHLVLLSAGDENSQNAVESVEIKHLAGLCTVRHCSEIEDPVKYRKEPTAFYMSHKLQHDSYRASREDLLKLFEDNKIRRKFFVGMTAVDLEICRDCREAFSSRLATNLRPCRAMDTYCGAGGLSYGLDRSGATQTRWGVENDCNAAETFEGNLRYGPVVANESANTVLRIAVQAQKGETQRIPLDKRGRPLEELPDARTKEVEMISSGSPCQGFTTLNRFQKVDDIRRSLVCNGLSYVEHFRPKFFLFENVRGILQNRLSGHARRDGSTKKGIAMGYVKFMVRTLLSLNYQCRVFLAQAAHYGVPQSRRRFFIFASRRDIPLPNRPTPTHLFTSKLLVIRLPDGERFRSVTSRGAPHRFVPAKYALEDLPGFDYRYTNEIRQKIYKPSKAKQRELKARLFRRRGAYDPNKHHIGEFLMRYEADPSNTYAMVLRAAEMNEEDSGSEDEDSKDLKLTAHVTRVVSMAHVARICMVPLERLPSGMMPDHRDLPNRLDVKCLRHSEAAIRNRFYPGLWGRVDPESVFQTAIRTLEPSQRLGRVIHPNQHRLLTVRECARTQGFPDDFLFGTRYKFIDNDDDDEAAASSSRLVGDFLSQIGNAVPVPMAEAMGREVVTVMRTMHKIKNQ